MRLIFFLFNFLLILFIFSQEDANGFLKTNTNVDLAIAAGQKQYAQALSFNKYHPIGKQGFFKIGYGLRFTNYFSSTKDYKTAPAKLTSGVENPSALFKENIIENIDTVLIVNPRVYYLNASINLQFTCFKKLDVEFNIDAIGFTLGSKRNGSYTSSKWDISNGPIPSTVDANPTRFNLLLVSDNDLGSLNSEILLRYHLNRHFSIKMGASFQFIEYTTTKRLRLDNNRFRYKSLMPMLGVSYWI
jgi:hypothetical protein